MGFGIWEKGEVEGSIKEKGGSGTENIGNQKLQFTGGTADIGNNDG